MKRKLLIRGGVGFLIGAAMVLLVPAIFNRGADGTVSFYSSRLVEHTGSQAAAMLTSLLLYGFYGFCCMGGTLLYDIERWPLALATAVHYLVIALGYALAAKLLCWELTPELLLIIEAMMTAGFFLIWLFLYLRYKAEVRELNRLMETNNTEKEQECEQ